MQLLLHITCVLSTHITYTTLSPAFTYKYHTALHTYIGSNPRHGTPFLPELKTGRQYYQSISNFTQFSMLKNIKGFCCHYGGFCEKENFIKTTYIYNKISKQICITICILLFYCPGKSMRTTPSFSESTKILEVAGTPCSLPISTGEENFRN